ncbi:MAG: hypothetical protein HY587_04600 [Candidatus Omnitrophica bacterium]|nr:hypothetical protein [Candidatus Omnitrophota bacterium]
MKKISGLLDQFRSDPLGFIKSNRIMPDGRPFGEVCHELQIEKMYRPLLDRVKRYFLFRLGRGYDKTSGIAFFCLTQILLSKRGIKIAIFAADLEQAGLLLQETKEFIERSALLRMIGIKINKFEIFFGSSSIKIMAADATTSYGGVWDIIVVDEFSSWSSDAHEQLFYSIYSTVAKKSNSILIILSNAVAAFSKVMIEILPRIRESSEWYIFEADHPAPWLDQKNLAEQKRFLPPLVYARLFENLDVPQAGNFISLNELELCIDPSLNPVERGKEGLAYFVGFDYGRKHDRSACVTVHQQEDGLIIVGDLWFTKGSRESPVKFEVVENYLLNLASRFSLGGALVDPFQMQNSMEKLQDAIPMSEFVFNQASWNILAQNLYHAIHFAKLRMFANSVLKNELLQLRLIETPQGLKFDHERKKGYYSDIATALALAVTACMRFGNALGDDAVFVPDTILDAARVNAELSRVGFNGNSRIHVLNPPYDLTPEEVEFHSKSWRSNPDPDREELERFGLI